MNPGGLPTRPGGQGEPGDRDARGNDGTGSVEAEGERCRRVCRRKVLPDAGLTGRRRGPRGCPLTGGRVARAMRGPRGAGPAWNTASPPMAPAVLPPDAARDAPGPCVHRLRLALVRPAANPSQDRLEPFRLDRFDQVVVESGRPGALPGPCVPIAGDRDQTGLARNWCDLDSISGRQLSTTCLTNSASATTSFLRTISPRTKRATSSRSSTSRVRWATWRSTVSSRQEQIAPGTEAATLASCSCRRWSGGGNASPAGRGDSPGPRRVDRDTIPRLANAKRLENSEHPGNYLGSGHAPAGPGGPA